MEVRSRPGILTGPGCSGSGTRTGGRSRPSSRWFGPVAVRERPRLRTPTRRCAWPWPAGSPGRRTGRWSCRRWRHEPLFRAVAASQTRDSARRGRRTGASEEERRRQMKRRVWLVALAGLTLVAGACGGEEEEADETGSPTAVTQRDLSFAMVVHDEPAG